MLHLDNCYWTSCTWVAPFFDPMPSSIYMSSQAVACHRVTHSVYLVLEEGGGSWYLPVPCIQLDSDEQFHKGVNKAGTLGHVVYKFCLGVHSFVCCMTSWKIFPCQILNAVISVGEQNKHYPGPGQTLSSTDDVLFVLTSSNSQDSYRHTRG